ncbi:MAG: HAMP domain-containing histidine kinase [Clostridia bacterium]|nr:HAMP domain-containing histidine kinase [Clostridia bacterium]
MKNKLSAIGSLNTILIIGTAAILLIALFISSVLEYTFVHFKIINLGASESSNWYWIFVFAGTSIIVGLLLAVLLGKILFKPFNTIVNGMTRLSEGDFSTRIDLGKYDAMKVLTNRFNALAQELDNTEILRSNFVNDFSHELKTPIVSISGLISLMKNENLDAQKRKQYLNIMEEEAGRLTQMTSNALYLSKIETQGILTNKTRFNVSEQIRDSVLLLERKWDKKALSLNLDFDEYEVMANDDMLKHVWLNIIDNAIKFSRDGGELKIAILQAGRRISVAITNDGEPIPEEERELIFNKFYQSDSSRSTEGNGIGLSIVKHIVTLHGGEIAVECVGGKTTFTVELPIGI